MTIAQARALQKQLEKVFKHHNLNVAVGITKRGVAVRSQDDAVDATNLNEVRAQ
jgi:hypothetical protein